MNTDLMVVLALLGAAILMFVINKPRMDAVGLLMITVLPFTGTVTMPEALAGFADSSIVLIAALFVIGEGLVRTGVARRLGDWLYEKAGDRETLLLVLLMVAAAGLGSLMSSTAVVAIFIPVVLRICRNTGTLPSQLMMPLSNAALISGMLTLVATAPNLVVNAELVRQGHAGLGFFSFTPFGLPILIIGIGYMLVARRMLPSGRAQEGEGKGRPSLRKWIDQYALSGHAHLVRLQPGSPIAGKRLDMLELRHHGLNLLAIERRHRFHTEILRPNASTILEAGDVLLVDAMWPELDPDQMCREYLLERLPLIDGGYLTDRTQEIGLVEALIPPDSALIGKTVLEARVRTVSGLTVIGLRHGRNVVRESPKDEKLKAGDTLLLTGFWADIGKLRNGGDLLVLSMPSEMDEVLPAGNRAVFALGSLALVVVLMVTGVVPNVQAALIGCLVMGLTGCIDLNSAYRSISWKTLVLIVGMLPFSIALQRTGGVDMASNALLEVVGEAEPRIVLGALFLITALLGLFISNTATAVLMAPVALAVAHELKASPYPFAMTVALAASAAFMTPISSPVNTLVVGPGNYSFSDFVKVGVPFAIIAMAVSVLLVPIVMPLY